MSVPPLHVHNTLTRSVDLDHSPPHGARFILQRGLVEKVARAAWRFMMLQRVIGQVLGGFGKQHAIDLASSTFPNQTDMLVYLGESRTESCDRPLQGSVSIDESFLMGEVPHLAAPILQVDEPQHGAR